MGPSTRSSRSRRKNPTKLEDVNKENAGDGRVLRSGRRCVLGSPVQSCTSENEKHTTYDISINQTKTKSQASAGVPTPRPLGRRREHLVVTSTPNVAGGFKPPDFTCSVSSNLPEPTLLQKKNECMFARQYVARPKGRGPILVAKRRAKKKTVDAVTREAPETNSLPKSKRVFVETADFFGVAEVSSNSPSPPPLQTATDAPPTSKSAARDKAGSEISMKGKKHNKIKPEKNCEDFNRWMDEFNSELHEAENFEFKIVESASNPAITP